MSRSLLVGTHGDNHQATPKNPATADDDASAAKSHTMFARVKTMSPDYSYPTYSV